MTEQMSPQFADVLRRLRARSVSSFEVGDREVQMRTALQALEDLTARAEGRARHTVPEVEPYAYVDQLTVLLEEARLAGVDPAAVQALMTDLAADLSLG
ncbi:hypothetical protein D1871_21150 [Nakamurella silvestris]|nr:hypothetical protein D1871_21150 [Nakamurella silvestris]